MKKHLCYYPKGVIIIKNFVKKRVKIMCLKICYFGKESQRDGIAFDTESLHQMGFDLDMFYGKSHKAFEYFSKNKFDILIVNTMDMDKDRMVLIIDIIYNNFCKNMLVITSEPLQAKSGMYFLSPEDLQNIDLKIDTILLEMKRNKEGKSAKNMPLIRSKICDYLITLCFNSRLDGFRYYVEAVSKIFMRFPEKYSMMDIYTEIGELYGKSAYAVEKSMRSSLVSAMRRVNSLPNSKEFENVRGVLEYDMNNKLTTHMLVNRLMLDEDIKKSMAGDDNYSYVLNI